MFVDSEGQPLGPARIVQTKPLRAHRNGASARLVLRRGDARRGRFGSADQLEKLTLCWMNCSLVPNYKPTAYRPVETVCNSGGGVNGKPAGRNAAAQFLLLLLFFFEEFSVITARRKGNVSGSLRGASSRSCGTGLTLIFQSKSLRSRVFDHISLASGHTDADSFPKMSPLSLIGFQSSVRRIRLLSGRRAPC